METLIRRRMGAMPFGTFALGAIAITALGLTAIGLMATIGWWVRQRTRELGVRLALGASRGSVRAMVFRQGMLLAVLGVGAGCVVAVGVTRYLESWVYGITPLDPPTFVGCGLLMLVIAAGAVYVPVRRATSIDPLTALRTE